MRRTWKVPLSLVVLAVLVFVAGVILQNSVASKAIAYRFHIVGGVLTLLAWLSAALRARKLLRSPNTDKQTMKQARAVLTFARRSGWTVLIAVVAGVLGFFFLAWAIFG